MGIQTLLGHVDRRRNAEELLEDARDCQARTGNVKLPATVL